MTTLFESDHYESRTKGSNIKLQNVHLSILAASTTQTYENVWSSQFTDIGFNNRLFLVTGSGERRFSIPPKIPPNELDPVRTKLLEILGRIPHHPLQVEAIAYEKYDQWYKGFDRSIHSKRLDTYALRLMLLLAVNEGKDSIDEQVVTQAIELCNWQLNIRIEYDPIDADNAIAKIEEKIRRKLKSKGGIKDHELKRAINAYRDGLWAYDNAKKNLEAAGEIAFDKKSKKYVWIGD